jgi:superfamily II DNA or RNA helicase
VRSAGHRDAAGLAVAADASHARQLAKLLHEVTGRAPVVVLHTDADAARKLADFRASREPWIVAVNMVSEGVDVPRLRVGVYASAAKTALIFRQIVGRFVRTSPHMPAEPSWLYLPAEQTLRGHASEIESELRHALRDVEPREDLEQPPERRQSEQSPSAEFVPLSAEFAAQMTLFGAPQRAPSSPPAEAPSLALESAANTSLPPPLEPVVTPVFVRRADLRRERTHLVAELHRRDGRSHREINSWVNRVVGLERVEQASIEQLERSIETLVKELTRTSRRGAPA